jgi:hypothetical protein
MSRVSTLHFIVLISSAYSAFAGNVKTVSGQFKKSDLCTEHRLNVSNI